MKPVRCLFTAASALVVIAATAWSQGLSPELKSKVEAKAKQLQALSTDAAVVSAVKSYNNSASAEAKGMTNEKWKGLTVLDPFVRSLTRNALGEHLKGKRDEVTAECFVSGADGGKVAFLSKTTSWSHKGKEKHSVPMGGKIYYGPMEVDESTGVQLIQVGLPVFDGGKPIGSIVVGLAVARLK